MQPTNKSERRKALLNFMLLFLVCSGIIITTVFFSTRIPLKQTNQLLEFKNSVVKRDELKSEFTVKLIIISKMIDSLDQKNQTEISETDFRIEDGIKNLKNIASQVKDEIDNNFYSTATKNLTLYHLAKKAVRGNTDNNAKEKESKDRIEKLKAEAEKYHDKWTECMYSKK